MSTIQENDGGRLDYVNGELRNRSKIDDPVAFRLESPFRSIGKLSGSATEGGTVRELVLDQFKRDERYWFGSGVPENAYVGEWTRGIRAPGQDGCDTRIQTVRFDGSTYHVPIIGEVGMTIRGESRFVHPGGRFVTTFQGDGNIVTYRALPDGSPNFGAPVWASGFSEP
jgi:hypothetical protein